MLKRHLRLKARRDISLLFQRGLKCSGSLIIVRVRENGLPSSRIMSVVSTKVDKRATKRNLLRRRIVASAQEIWAGVDTGWDIAVIVKNETKGATKESLQNELQHCLNRLGVLH